MAHDHGPRRWRRPRAEPKSPPPVLSAEATPSVEWVEISLDAFEAVRDGLIVGPIGDGLDEAGRPFSIRRYTCSRTGTIYDACYEAGVTRVWQSRPIS